MIKLIFEVLIIYKLTLNLVSGNICDFSNYKITTNNIWNKDCTYTTYRYLQVPITHA